MTYQEQQNLLVNIEHRIQELHHLIHSTDEFATQKKQQDDDPDASLDLLINAPIDAQRASEYHAEINALTSKIAWLKCDDAGYCKDCGDEIPMARLNAVLGARDCIACAERKQA